MRDRMPRHSKIGSPIPRDLAKPKPKPKPDAPVAPIDSLISICQNLVRFLQQTATYVAPENKSIAKSLDRAALALENTVRQALSAPSEESLPREDSFIDTLIESMRDPSVYPTRLQVLWTLSMLRQARKLIRVYMGSAEITEPAENLAPGQRWLDAIDHGPVTPK